MAAYTVYAQSAGNWDKASNWNTAAGGGGSAFTNPQNGANTFICDLNSYAVTLNVAVTVTTINQPGSGGTLVVPAATSCSVTAAITAAGASYLLSWGAASGSLTVTGDFTYSQTYAGSMTVGTGQTLTINGKVTESGSGTAVASTGTGTLTINNGTGIALTTSSTGYALSHGSTATLNVTGYITSTGANGALAITAVCTANVSNGDNAVINVGAGNYRAIYVTAAATLNLTGTITSASTSTNGLIYFTASNAVMTITKTTPGSGTLMTHTGSGRLIYFINTATLTVTATNGTALAHSGSGTAIAVANFTWYGNMNITGSGTGLSCYPSTAATFTGNVTMSVAATSNYGIQFGSGSGTITLTGNVTAGTGTSTGYGLYIATSGGGKILHKGNLTSSGNGVAVYCSQGTYQWDATATRYVDAGTDCYMQVSGTGTFDLTNVTLEVTGRLCIHKMNGTLTLTGATIRRQTVGAQATVLGFSANITGPTMPAADKVKNGESYGYAGAPATGTMPPASRRKNRFG